MARQFASGNWVVKAGREEEFAARWTEFLEATAANAPGFRGVTLIRDDEDPSHLISIAEWDSLESLLAWRALPEFPERLAACRALCDDFRGSNYVEVASVGMMRV